MDTVTIAAIWSAVAATAGAVGTLILAWLTYQYVKATNNTVAEMRATRLEQTRPYVSVYFMVHEKIIYLNIKNTGQTAAKDVVLSPSEQLLGIFDPKLKPPVLEQGIPILAPGIRYRTVVDSAINFFSRAKHENIPQTWTCSIKYTGLQTGETYDESAILDLSQFYNRTSSERPMPSHPNIEDIAKELQGIRITLRELTD